MKIGQKGRLVLLAVALTVLWLFGGLRPLSRDESHMWRRVRDGQTALWQAQTAAGIPLSTRDDGNRTGLIGVEWSALSTTLGDLRAKRTSCNPLWAARFAEWFDELGLTRGDRVVVYSSSSFPALLQSALVAAEHRGLHILLGVSLGSSMWGANRPEFPWPEMQRTLLQGGHIRTQAAFYTPGGGGEVGRGLAPEMLESLRAHARENAVPFVVLDDLQEVVAYKTQRMEAFAPALLISIGGSNANLGDSESAHAIPNGLLRPSDAVERGDGVVRNALERGIPVLNVLNVRGLARDAGIPWDAAAFLRFRIRSHPAVAFVGLLLFAIVLGTHRRWEWAER